jgi:hypothetical protein
MSGHWISANPDPVLCGVRQFTAIEMLDSRLGCDCSVIGVLFGPMARVVLERFRREHHRHSIGDQRQHNHAEPQHGDGTGSTAPSTLYFPGHPPVLAVTNANG